MKQGHSWKADRFLSWSRNSPHVFGPKVHSHILYSEPD